MKKIILSIIFCLILVSSFASAWWNEDWTMRKEVIITENSGTSLYNYPIRMTIDAEDEMQYDFDDLRCTDDYENPLDYWIENIIGDTKVNVWVEIPVIQAGDFSFTNGVNQSLNLSTILNESYGMRLETKEENIQIDEIKIVDGVTQPNCAILDSNKEVLWNSTWDDGKCYPDYTLSANTVYFIV